MTVEHSQDRKCLIFWTAIHHYAKTLFGSLYIDDAKQKQQTYKIQVQKKNGIEAQQRIDDQVEHSPGYYDLAQNRA